MPGLFIADMRCIPFPFPLSLSPFPFPFPLFQVSLIVRQFPLIFNVEEHHIDNKVVTYCPQDYITVTGLPWLKFGALNQVFQRTIH